MTRHASYTRYIIASPHYFKTFFISQRYYMLLPKKNRVILKSRRIVGQIKKNTLDQNPLLDRYPTLCFLNTCISFIRALSQATIF